MATSGEEGSHGASDSIVTEFATYEDFLDSQITPTDLYYLEVSCFEACEFTEVGKQFKENPMADYINHRTKIVVIF